jgi:hypothetical protein
MPLQGNPRPCTATSKRTGEQCKNPARKGAAVCRSHGGNAPQVQAKARERLAVLVDPAIKKLGEFIRDGGLSPQALAAVRDVLDRAGLQAPKVLELHTVDEAAVLAALAAAEAELAELSELGEQGDAE